ncbi:cellular nucleic acid-binding protein, partial [Trifolium medium]|nr:cellular nucleic acid-binding protein [Trifolium medium]
YYNTPEAEYDKCVKFESGLRLEVKHLIVFSEIRYFPTLVNKSRICDEDGRAKVNHYKAVNDNKRKGQDRVKPYGDNNKKIGESSGGRKKIG